MAIRHLYRTRLLVGLLVALLGVSVGAQFRYIGFAPVVVDDTAGGVIFPLAQVNPTANPQATSATCSLETAAIRYQIDGVTAVTASVGMPWLVGETKTFQGHDILLRWRGIRTTGTSGDLSCTFSAP